MFELLINDKKVKESMFVTDLARELSYLIQEENTIPYDAEGELEFDTITIRRVKP